MRISDETLDGILFGLALVSNPKIAAAKADYEARRRAFAETTKGKTKAEMITELKAHNPAYIVEVMERDTEGGIRQRYVATFMPRAR